MAQWERNLPAMQETHTGSTPGWGRSPGGGNSNSLQYSCLENSIDRGGWQTTVHGVAAKSQTCLSTWHVTHDMSQNPGGRTSVKAMAMGMDRKSQILEHWWSSPTTTPISGTQDNCKGGQEGLNPDCILSSLAGHLISESHWVLSSDIKQWLPTWQELWRSEKRYITCLAHAWHEASPRRIVASVINIISTGGTSRMWGLTGPGSEERWSLMF